MLFNLVFCLLGMFLFGWGALLFANAFRICDGSVQKHFALSIGMIFAAILLLGIFDPGVPLIEMFRMIAAGK